MPSQETAFRRDKVLYWPKSGVDRYGQAKKWPSTPIEIVARWDDKKTLGRDPQGNRITLDAQIVAAQNMIPESIVLHSTLADYVGTGSNNTDLEFYEVVTMDKTPDIKNRANAFVVGLQRYKGQLPSSIG